MRRAPLSATLLVGSLLFASGGLATTASKDTRAVRKELASARTLGAALRALVPSASSEIARQLRECPGIQPSGQPKQARLSTLVALERIRQLQHFGLVDFESFGKTALDLHFTDKRLLTAQAALAAELESMRELTSVPIRVCDDLKAFAKAGYTAAALESWAKEIDRKAGVSEEDAKRTDKLILKSRPALVAAGLSAANATILLHAETGDVFLYAGLRSTPG